MTLTLLLTPEEEQRIAAAQAHGMDVTALFRNFLSDLPIPANLPAASETLNTKNQALIDLMHRWSVEDAAMMPEEIAAEDAMWDEIMTNIENNRIEFPEVDLDLSDD